MNLVGQVLDDRYRLVKLIGSGSTGDVYQADHIGLGRTFAVKVLHDVLAGQPTFASRFKREGKALARLAHPNIVRVFDACVTSDSHLYIVMELVDGERLDRILRHVGAFTVARALRIAKQLASAIDHAHQAEVLHRDLRPPNLLVSQSPAGDDVKILDFGISKIIAADYRESRVVSREYAGTEVLPHYKSPEQLRFTRVDGTCDIYAIGCILYEMLTGERPFVGSNAEVINGHLSSDATPPSKRTAGAISSALDKVVMTCLAKDPRKRFQSGRELLLALEHFDSKGSTPRRNVHIADGGAGSDAGTTRRELREVTGELAKMLLPTGDADIRRAKECIHDLEAQHDLLSQEAQLAREHAERLNEWSTHHHDLLTRSDFADEIAALRAEAQTRAARLEELAGDLGAAINEACAVLAAEVSRLLSSVPPSSEAFLLVHRFKRLRSG